MTAILDATRFAFESLWMSFADFLPVILGALVVFLVGWAIAIWLGRLITLILKTIKLDEVLEKTGLGKILEQGGAKIEVANWIGLLVKWFFIFVFLMASTDILGWSDVTGYLNTVVSYIPNVIVAAVIVIVAAWAAGVMQKIVAAAAGAGQAKAGAFAAALTKWAILIFGLMAALSQLQVAPGLIQTLVTGFVAMLAIAGGLAFGLGAKDQAGKFIDTLRKEISE
ncbi:MAG: hypothetical protein COU81_01110 [Candidatus Portnoybacteria bacterium CG10_big_fil_rev_8_21_14_0_10_36_7]|uniref:Small-conductance mechanosensitive ion channel n=1 Tax=Candidatus Portnoybacteria bacterium CG10_big_fil_rev_8_21_14_0_10_36_7 TaxID=1974812 RepID=A0A2M8KEN3_9BACT|nr:MAG: hypothetical protein COU81_01110 [Candidatus Portnoybacteria bacterium CG10_big_fil_rev_8_21_14_0_10_36_7]